MVNYLAFRLGSDRRVERTPTSINNYSTSQIKIRSYSAGNIIFLISPATLGYSLCLQRYKYVHYAEVSELMLRSGGKKTPTKLFTVPVY